MFDLILIVFTLVCFAAGFWCGKTYGSVGAMFKQVKAKIVGWMS
jgi:hypothetical protein